MSEVSGVSCVNGEILIPNLDLRWKGLPTASSEAFCLQRNKPVMTQMIHVMLWGMLYPVESTLIPQLSKLHRELYSRVSFPSLVVQTPSLCGILWAIC